jgi:hypothetical protein
MTTFIQFPLSLPLDQMLDEIIPASAIQRSRDGFSVIHKEEHKENR